MTKKILLLIGVFAFGLLQAQVGINIKDPQAVFHFSGVEDAKVNNDIVITKEGNIGIATLAPTAKVDVRSASANMPAFQMNQGGQDGVALLSDANGVARWNPIPGAWYGVLMDGSMSLSALPGGNLGLINFTTGMQSGLVLGGSGQSSVAPASAMIRVPYTGRYKVSVTGSGFDTYLTNDYYVIWLNLVYGDSSSIPLSPRGAWAPHLMGHTDTGWMSFGFSSVLSLNAWESIRVYGYCNSVYSANLLSGITFTVEFLM